MKIIRHFFTLIKSSNTTIALFWVFVCSINITKGQALLTDFGTANAYQITYPANLNGTVPQGIEFTFKASNANTGASTLQINGITATSIVKNFNIPLAANDIKVGHFVKVIYDGTNLQMLSSSANPSTGTIGGGGTVNGVAFFSNNNTITADGTNFNLIRGNYTSLNLGKITIRSTSSTGDNLAIGTNAGNTVMTGTNNAFYGIQSGQGNSAGSDNSFYGANSGISNTLGNQNVFLGTSAGQSNTSGTQNTFIGSGAANMQTTGSNNIALGYNAQMGANNLTNAIAIGSGANITGSNSAVIGAGITGLGINTGAPTAMIDVNGGARIRNLSASGAVFADANGNLSVSTSSGANAWTINGTNIIPQNLSNKVSIGQTSGNYDLSIYNPNIAGVSVATQGGSGTSGASLILQSRSTSSGINLGQPGTKGWEFAARGDVYSVGTQQNNLYLNYFDGTGFSVLYNFDKNGRLGLGGIGDVAFTPQNRLDIKGNMAIGVYAGVNTAPANGLIVSGNVGIGNTTPNGNLSFANTTSIRRIVLFEAANNDHQFYGIGNPANALNFQIEANNSLKFFTFSAASSTSATVELMRIRGDGNVGIGTTAPGIKLDVRGTNLTSITGIKESIIQVAATDGNPLRLVMGVKTDAIPANRFTFIEALDGGGPQPLVLQPINGNVGIGTTLAGAKLDVAGNFKLGSSGTILTNLIQGCTTTGAAFGNAAANASTNIDFTLVNTTTTDKVWATSAGLVDGLVIQSALISAVNTVRVRVRNTTAVAITLNNTDFCVVVIKP